MSGSGGKRTAAWAIVIALAIVAMIAAVILIAPGIEAGDQFYSNEEGMREAVKVLVDAYASLVALISAGFGAIAFLVTYQQSRGGTLSARAWGLLFSAVVLLAGALILAFVGREALLTMVTHNAVDITWPIVSIARWASYACVVLAAALTVWFALEVAFTPPAPKRLPLLSAILDNVEEK